MKAYMFHASWLCEDCGKAVSKEVDRDGVQDTGDSDAYPQGPYGDGGGEADCPQHCDHCHVFLENPLTADGEEYVRDALRDRRYLDPNDPRYGDPVVLGEWRDHYSYLFNDD
jgi:hypothetical protein